MRTENRNIKKTAECAAFTLVEMLLVVAIIGILATVVVVSVAGRYQTSMVRATRGSITSLGTAVRMYELDTGNMPQSLQHLVQSSGAPHWNGPYVDKLFDDAWGTPFGYSTKDSKSFEIRSAGADKQMGTQDDITN